MGAGEFTYNAETLDGRFHHRRVDMVPKRTREATEEESAPDEPIHERSVWLSSEQLGLTAKIDLLEGVGTAVAPLKPVRSEKIGPPILSDHLSRWARTETQH
ncbi:MAG: hypothetical protein AB7P17_06815 [Nitrospirales bacterium]|nr:hypothetical protein [Nitrospirales bacterium]